MSQLCCGQASVLAEVEHQESSSMSSLPTAEHLLYLFGLGRFPPPRPCSLVQYCMVFVRFHRFQPSQATEGSHSPLEGRLGRSGRRRGRAWPRRCDQMPIAVPSAALSVWVSVSHWQTTHSAELKML